MYCMMSMKPRVLKKLRKTEQNAPLRIFFVVKKILHLVNLVCRMSKYRTAECTSTLRPLTLEAEGRIHVYDDAVLLLAYWAFS